MSSRVLKKLHGEPELDAKEAEDILSDIESEKEKKQINNRYDLLNEQSLSESEVKEDDNETEHTSTATPHPIEAKKKKKKRKKKSGKHATNRRSSEDNADIDEISRTVREVDKLFGKTTILPVKSTTPHKVTALHSLLKVQHKNLNPSYEMKRMFGSKVVQAEQNKRRNARGARPLKSTWLVSPRDNWQPVSNLGLSMSIDTNQLKDNSLTWFKFEHSTAYRALQLKFLRAVESMDSENIVQIIHQQPYHIDSLIQLSELCKMSEDHAMASGLIEHAILAYELGFNTMFNLTTAECRLDYRRQENRGFFIVLFKHTQYLEARACARTALEVGKLILSFDPLNDPLAMILVLDYYAIRAKQYLWLIQLYQEWENVKKLAQLPNMAYSYALCLFYESNDDTSLADNAIQYALMMFPGVLKPLLDELSVQVDSRVNTHSYFNANVYTSQSAALQQLTSLYACRSKTVWRDAAILPWLERNVNIVLDRVDAKDSIVGEYTQKRGQRYNKTPPREILRHIILSDFKEKVPLAPFINKDTEPILMYDPLPPADTINIYTRPNMPSRILQSRSPFSMFFQSLLPNFNIQEFAAAAAAVPMNEDGANQAQGNNAIDALDGEAAGANQHFADFRASVNSIVDAMRNFISDIRVPERPNDADVDENESSDDEPNDYLT
ncbi:Transcription factor 25 [Pseudolycoriella hygida]|uniref:Transcription factor 25 n=1 Tax=Pseudolycoriella hygida TaxID=35572 RepID=A0A9Q0N6Z6_9DIPT|nr:Transcription factor 25 [Pseudolycoriella hygida]